MRSLPLLLLALGPLVTPSAFGAPLVVRGDDVTRTLACSAAQDVTVTGSGHHLTVTGDCGTLQVRGSDAVVTVDGVAAITVVGSGNQVIWSRNLSGKEPLPVSTTGSGNQVRQGGGSTPSGSGGGKDAAPTAGGGGGSHDALVVNGSGSHKTLTCAAGQDVTIRGSMHDLTLEGDCGAVHVDGSSIQVHADGVASIRVEGSMNQIHWARNLSGAPTLPVSKSGSMNEVSGP